MGKDIDRVRGRAALETIKESPVIAAIMLLPVLAVFAGIWWLINLPVAIIALVAAIAVFVVKGRLLS